MSTLLPHATDIAIVGIAGGILGGVMVGLLVLIAQRQEEQRHRNLGHVYVQGWVAPKDATTVGNAIRYAAEEGEARP